MVDIRSFGLGTALLLINSWVNGLPSPILDTKHSELLGLRGPAGAAVDDYHWVASWTSMPQLVESNNMPPSPFVRRPMLFKALSIRYEFMLTINELASPVAEYSKTRLSARPSTFPSPPTASVSKSATPSGALTYP